MNDIEFKQLKNAIALKMAELRSLQNQHLAETGQEYLALGHRTDTDVTAQVEFGSVDGETLPLDRCVCGYRFGHWDEMLSVYRDDPWICPACGRKLYFKQKITVWEKRDDY